ncbi:DUF2004 domain-containing protein [Glaciibacter psychrotolerans]|uniref:DUF2004 domain-containing protein n=1 Tax=Glaciibacter psychrotolerans TaxID=670054 RepID=A0A7Z0EDI3_9MICO|nr:DUF2004 domain-containing protein [Leifsonia psychrotolerans]NYJ19456.1 hypothetical protein [Leifsonia psychrotolerans]
MTIEHDFFGVLGSDGAGEMYWSEVTELGDQNVDITLSAPDEDSVKPESLDIAAAMVNAIEDLDTQVRESLVAELSSEGSTTAQFIEQSIDDLGPEALGDAVIWDSGDQQIDFLRSLRLQRVGFYPHHGGSDEHFALLDYSIAPHETDTLLIIAIDINGDTVTISIDD